VLPVPALLEAVLEWSMAVRVAVLLRVLGSKKGCEIVLGSQATQMGSSAAGGGRDYCFRYRARSLGSYPNPMPLFLYIN
jgi:hypothetical protein